MDPLVSVIIVNYNGKRYLKGCIDSLEAGEFKNFELIFVDNGSVDGSIAFIKEAFPKAKLIDNGANLGLAIASNRGAQAARGEHLFFFNNDTVADKNMLLRLVKRAEFDPNAAVVVPEAFFFHDSFCALEGDRLTTNVWKRQVGERNLIRTLLKNYSARSLLRILPRYVLFSAAEVL